MMPGSGMLDLMMVPVSATVGLLALTSRTRTTLDFRMLRVRGWWIILILAFLKWVYYGSHFPAGVSDQTATRVFASLTIVLVFLICAVNIRGRTSVGRVGMLTVMLGTVCNALPRVVYGAMPFSARAARTAGFAYVDTVAQHIGHVPISGQPVWMTAISDVIPVPALTKVVSLGDVALLAGAALMLASLANQGIRAVPENGTSHHSKTRAASVTA